MSDEIEITLTDHVGTSRSGEPVDHGQWIVNADDVQIGYMSKAPGAWLACIVSLDDETRQRIVEAVNRKVEQEIGGIVMPPPPIDDDDEEQGEDE